MIGLVILVATMIFGYYAQHQVTAKFRKWSEVPSTSGLSGAQVARRMLDEAGLQDVQVVHTPGMLTDHYDPRSRTVALSDGVYAERSISAVSVAAHECGHALQHQQQYAPLAFRSALFPAAAFGSQVWAIVSMVGMVMLFFMQMGALAWWVIAIGIGFFAFAVLFQIVTLPVEFDASRRAKQRLGEMAVVSPSEAAGSAQVLSAAAMTYVAGALASIGQLLYWVMILANNR